jgi:LPS-assembly protein
LHQLRVSAFVLLFPLLSVPADAAEVRWGLCELPATQSVFMDEPVYSDTPLELAADQAHMELNGTSVLLGDVEMWRNGQFLRADELYYTRPEGYIQARGQVRFEDQGLTVTGPMAEWWLGDDQASFTEPEYRYTPRHARGEAFRIERTSPNIAVLEDATYTTCDPGDTDWLLSADRITLDRESGDGTARNVVVRFKDLPILYTPWIRFPIDDRRQSGFLFPSAGISSRSGFTLELPYYWNIAPDHDATFTPRMLTDRGLQLQSEFRYLNPSNAGELDLELINDRKFGDQRYLARVRHTGLPLPRLRTVLDVSRASDEQYFEDFGNSLSIASQTYLQQRADLAYLGGFWDALARVQAFQTVDDTIPPQAEPYEQLPQVLLEGGLPDQALGLDYGLAAEWVNFEHDDRISGQRLDLDFGIDRPIVGPAYFVTPAVSLRHTAYSLDETNARFPEENITRTLPVASLDSGLIFERPVAGGEFLQTLEPRIFYLYVPFRSQDEIPIFDTGLLDFSFAQLFRKDRFIGPDRIGDANQLALAVTSRFLNTGSGYEALSASIGQILYFDDPEVTLPNQSFEDDETSDLAGELALRLGRRWTASASTLWDRHEDGVEFGAARLRYFGTDNRILNLAYRFWRTDPEIPFLDENLQQTDVAFVWPLGARWHVLGRWNYDLEEQRDLELLAGFEYESCCWKLRVAGRRFIVDDEIGDEAEYNNSIEVQLVLKGLTQLGSPLGELLERGILGYEAYD